MIYSILGGAIVFLISHGLRATFNWIAYDEGFKAGVYDERKKNSQRMKAMFETALKKWDADIQRIELEEGVYQMAMKFNYRNPKEEA